MTTPYDPRPARDFALLREVAAVILLCAGLIGLIGSAFAADILLGVATLSILAIAAGAALGADRRSSRY
jgi:hypothetical protein